MKLRLNFLHFFILLLGTINLSNASYGPNIQTNFQNITRNRRQTTNGSCQIPHNPPNGKYAIRGDDANTYKTEDYVPEIIFVLYLKCDGSYRPSPPETTVGSYCVNGDWEPPLGVCSPTCKSISTTETTEVQCSFNNLPLKNCENPVEGTVAKFTCEAFNEDSSLENNPYRFCEDGEWNGIPQCYPICGQKHPVGRTNVINGTNVKLGDYPWHVGVYNAQKEFRCGGAIITQRIILSAAHCFTSLATGALYPKENYLIAVGKYYRSYHDIRDEHYQYSTIDSIHIPSRYKGSKLQYQADIAVVILTNELVLTESVQPVCVDWGNQFENQQLTPNSYGTVTGWGYTVEGLKLSDELKELSIPFVPFDQCYDSVPKAFQTFLRQDKICGGYLDIGTSICGGDSGGGLVFPKRSTGRYFIRGVVSTSPATIERQCDSNQYGIFTLVSEHLDFINSIRNIRRPYPNTSTLRPISTSPPVTALSTTAPNLRCQIPYFTDYRIHTVQSASNSRTIISNQVGDLALADPFAVLTTRCGNESYSNSIYSVCIDGSWRPKPRNCSSLDLLPTKEVCGISQSAEYSAINVVTEAAINEFPWLVTLYLNPNEDELKYLSPICKGVLINNRYVLTAGLCPHFYKMNVARLGAHILSTECLNNGSKNICGPSPIDVPITEKILQDEYSDEIKTNGIGLLRLEWPVDFTDHIKPICLPTSDNLRNKNFENTIMIAAGWETDPFYQNGTIVPRNKIKSKLTVRVISTIQCATANNVTTNPKYICTEAFIDYDFCGGLWGSALMKFEQDEDRSNWYAFGIWSASGCYRDTMIPMIHARVTSYIPWILSKIIP